MGVRWVIHDENLGKADASDVLGRLAADVARDAARGVARRTGRTAQSIEVTSVSGRRATVTASPRNPNSSPEEQAYAAHLERGTSDTDPQPFMRPALYQYRTPGDA